MPDSGRDPAGQALVASDGAASVSTLTGFDPSRLAERCEQATGPDRELNEAIAEHLEPGMFTRDEHKRLRKNIHGTILTPQWDLWTPPAYTASLDAAMTLVPEGMRWLAGYAVDGSAIATVDFDHQRKAATPALALCAAALRARAASRIETGTAETEGLGPQDESLTSEAGDAQPEGS